MTSYTFTILRILFGWSSLWGNLVLIYKKNITKGMNMKLKLLAVFAVVAFSLSACGGSTTAASSISGVQVPAKVEVIPDS